MKGITGRQVGLGIVGELAIGAALFGWVVPPENSIQRTT